jgi:hypothetical protein
MMVAETVLIKQLRFERARTLVISGERAEESARAKIPGVRARPGR